MLDHYSQPNFYHFSEDSIFLADIAAKHSDADLVRVLDLCSGCGVVGIEFQQKHKAGTHSVEFVELQPAFKAHLERNISTANLEERSQIFFSCFMEFCPAETYDLILCNPPYYDEKRSRLPDCANRRMCRFFSRPQFLALLQKLESWLTTNGKAFVLIEHTQWEDDLVQSNLRILERFPFDQYKSVYSLGLNVE